MVASLREIGRLARPGGGRGTREIVAAGRNLQERPPYQAKGCCRIDTAQGREAGGLPPGLFRRPPRRSRTIDAGMASKQ
jgi:hypothetical protein